MKFKGFLIILLAILFLFVSSTTDLLAASGRGRGSGSSLNDNSNPGRRIGRIRNENRPRLVVRFPRGLEGCGPFDFTLRVTNRGTGTAKNVVVLVRFKKGQNFVSSVNPTLPFIFNVGDVPAGTSKIQNFRVTPNAAWANAGPDTEIGLFAEVTQETANPKDNLRRHDNSTADRENVSC